MITRGWRPTNMLKFLYYSTQYWKSFRTYEGMDQKAQILDEWIQTFRGQNLASCALVCPNAVSPLSWMCLLGTVSHAAFWGKVTRVSHAACRWKVLSMWVLSVRHFSNTELILPPHIHVLWLAYFLGPPEKISHPAWKKLEDKNALQRKF